MNLLTITLLALGIPLIMLRKYSAIKSIENSQSGFIQHIKRFFLNEYFYEFCLGIIITIVGVTLAITLTNVDTNKKEINKTIELLQVFDDELEMIESYIGETILLLYEIKPDAMNELLRDSPIAPIITLDVIISNETVVSNITSYTYRSLLECQRTINLNQNLFIANKESDNLKLYVNQISSSIAFVRKVIAIEIRCLNKEIKEEDVKNEIDILIDKRQLDFYNKLIDSLNE